MIGATYISEHFFEACFEAAGGFALVFGRLAAGVFCVFGLYMKEDFVVGEDGRLGVEDLVRLAWIAGSTGSMV